MGTAHMRSRAMQVAARLFKEEAERAFPPSLNWHACLPGRVVHSEGFVDGTAVCSGDVLCWVGADVAIRTWNIDGPEFAPIRRSVRAFVKRHRPKLVALDDLYYTTGLSAAIKAQMRPVRRSPFAEILREMLHSKTAESAKSADRKVL